MKKAHIFIITIVAVMLLTGVVIFVQKKGTSDTENEKDTVNTDSNSDTAVVNIFSDKVNVTIGSVNGVAGSIVTVPVSFDTIIEKGVGCCNFSIEYDNTRVEVEEVVPGEIIGNNTDNLEYSLSDSKGMISFLFAGDNEKDSITQAGVFAYIKFKINENAPKDDYALTSGADISFGDSMLERVDYTFKDGKISVK